jgi:hypothetical protein
MPDVVQTADRTTQMPAGAPAEPSLALGRYRLVRRLGSGAFGVVWLAHDERLDRMVAVKRIELRDAQIAARAEREALAAARLSHPAIVALHEAGRDDAAVHLVSELVRGPALADLLDAGALSDRDVLRIGIALSDALEHAHGRGVIHRDVKPANVIVPERPAGESGLAKLTDFGVAAIAGDDGLTRTGDVVGTLAYMAPEQAEGGRVTGAADLYALALVLYEALSGSNPVRAGGAAATARRVGTRLPSLRRPRPDLPPELCDAVDTALLPDPEDRGTLEDLRDALVLARDDAGTVVGPVDPWTGDGDPPRTARRRGEDPRAERTDAARGPGGRVVTGAAAGLLSAAVLTQLPAADGASAAAIVTLAATIALAAALAPRLAWLGSVAALVVSLTGSGLPGVAVLVVAAALPVPVLMPRGGLAWWAPGGAVLAALASAGPAWPAAAGQASAAPRRAALAATGLWWVLLAEPVAGRALLLGPAAPAPAGWRESASDAWSEVLIPLLDSGAPLMAAPWAAAAVLLPLLVRGRHPGLDLAAVVVWSVALAVAAAAVASALGLPAGGVTVHGALAGAVLGALIALACAGARPPRSRAELP